jgi:hypothetical protein
MSATYTTIKARADKKAAQPVRRIMRFSEWCGHTQPLRQNVPCQITEERKQKLVEEIIEKFVSR